MAKQTNDTGEVKKLLEGLYKIVQTTNAQSQEQVRINKELLKVMTLLQSGFAKNEEDAKDLINDVREGLEIQDEYAIKWAKHRKAEKADLDAIIKKFREIEDLHEDEIDNAEDYLDLLDGRYNKLADELDITKTLMSSQKEILKIIQDNKRVYDKIGGSVLDIDDKLSNIVRKKMDLSSLFGGTSDAIAETSDLLKMIGNDMKMMIANVGSNVIDLPFEFNPLTGELDKKINEIQTQINEEVATRMVGLNQYFAANKKMQKDIERNYAAQFGKLDLKVDVDTGDIVQGLNKIKKGTVEYQQIVNQLDDIILKNNIGDTLTSNLSELTGLMSVGILRTKEQTQRFNELLQPLGLANKLMIEQLDIRNADNQMSVRLLSVEREKFRLMATNLDLMQSTESAMRKVGSSFDYINSILPAGIGEMLGFSNVSNLLMANHRKGVDQLVTKLTEGGSRAEALKSYYKEMIPAVKSVLTPVTMLVASMALLYKFVEGVDGKLKEMSSEMQVSLLQSKQLLNSQLDILTSSKNQFATMSDIQTIQTKMIGDSGKYYSAIKAGNDQTIISIAEMGKAFGYGAEEATNIHKIFSDLGASDDLAVNLQGNLGLLSEMAGLSPQIVGKDLIEASETMYTYFAGMPEKAAKAAIEVRRMGLSLKQAGSIAQKMLDLEGFMTDMYELNAMSAKGIDFSAAFDKGLMGDIQGMTKEIMENIGDTARFNSMDYLTRTKIAKTLGMSMDELGKSVKMHEQMSQFGVEERANLEANVDRMGDISKLGKEQIRERLQQLQSTDRLMVAWDKIKGVFVKALLPLVEIFADGIDAISPVIDLIVFGLKAVGSILKPISFILKGMMLPFKYIGQALGMITENLDGSNNRLTGMKAFAMAVVGPFKFVADIIGSILGKLTGVKSEIGQTTGLIDTLKTPLQVVGSLISTWFVGKKVASFFGLIKSESKGLSSFLPSFDFFKKGKVADNPTEQLTQSIDNLAAKIDGIGTKFATVPPVVEKAVTTSTKKIDGAVVETGKKVDKLKKSSSGIFSNLGASEGFKTARAIGITMVAKMAIDQGRKLFGMGENITNGISSQQPNIEAAMSGAFSIGGVLLSGYLDQAISKVFEKKLEKKFEKGLEPVGKNAKDKFKEIGGSVGNIIDPLKEKSRNVFTIIGNYAKKLIPFPFSVLEQGLDSIKPKDVELPTVEKTEKVKNITEQVKTSTVEATKKSVKQTVTKPTIEIPEPKQPTKLKSFFSSVNDIIGQGWDKVKTIVLDIVKFIGDVGKSVTESIGKMISNILGGIADGLNKFKTNAIKGAASLLIVSGALWVTSKAMQNFANVSWSDVGKGLVTLTGLAGVGMMLGKTSGQMIQGSIAIALLGASLIPAAYALTKFTEVEWSSIGKGITAIVGLGIIGTVLGPLLPVLASASLGIALLGASIIPMAFSLKMLNDVEWSSIGKGITALLGFGLVGSVIGVVSPLLVAGSVALAAFSGSVMLVSAGISGLVAGIQSIDPTNLISLTNSLINLSSISTMDLLSISAGLLAISASLSTFSVAKVIGGLDKSFSSDIVSEFEGILDPIQTVNTELSKMIEQLGLLGQSMPDLKMDEIKLPTPTDLSQNIKLFRSEEEQRNISYESGTKPILSKVQPQQPTKQATAQNINVQTMVEKQREYEIQHNAAVKDELEYSSDSLSSLNTKRIEQLLQQLIQVTAESSKGQPSVNLDSYKIGNMIKKHNNR